MAQQRRDPDQRPLPEALLEAARREDNRVGRLKIFIGAAPGVGKTYEMLQSAHAKLKAGVDIVVGVVETHGRAETEAPPTAHSAKAASPAGPREAEGMAGASSSASISSPSAAAAGIPVWRIGEVVPQSGTRRVILR